MSLFSRKVFDIQDHIMHPRSYSLVAECSWSRMEAAITRLPGYRGRDADCSGHEPIPTIPTRQQPRYKQRDKPRYFLTLHHQGLQPDTFQPCPLELQTNLHEDWSFIIMEKVDALVSTWLWNLHESSLKALMSTLAPLPPVTTQPADRGGAGDDTSTHPWFLPAHRPPAFIEVITKIIQIVLLHSFVLVKYFNWPVFWWLDVCSGNVWLFD